MTSTYRTIEDAIASISAWSPSLDGTAIVLFDPILGGIHDVFISTKKGTLYQALSITHSSKYYGGISPHYRTDAQFYWLSRTKQGSYTLGRIDDVAYTRAIDLIPDVTGSPIAQNAMPDGQSGKLVKYTQKFGYRFRVDKYVLRALKNLVKEYGFMIVPAVLIAVAYTLLHLLVSAGK